MERRDFIRILSTGAVVSPFFIRSYPSFSSPNDRIQLGCIGLGGMGCGDMADFLTFDEVDVVALCDVDSTHLARAAGMVKERRNKTPDTCLDFRDLLGRHDIDAVLIATPDHWHGIITALACKSGKDVYVEKPFTHNIREGRLAVQAARANSRVTQLGCQVHASLGYHKAVEIIQSGALGTITQARAWLSSNQAPQGIGKPEDGTVPEGLDYNFWLGPAPQRPYNPNRSHFKWRYFWDYGGGQLADFTCHMIDVFLWGTNPGFPRRVSAVGGRYALEDNAETPDTLNVVWEFDPPQSQSSPLQLIWSHTECNADGLEGRSKGLKLCGTQGTLIVDYGWFIHKDPGGKVIQEFKEEGNPVGDAGIRHKREFLDCIRSRSLCSADIEYGHQLTTLANLGNISHRVGRTLAWDGETETISHDPQANRLVQREYRKGWDLAALGVVDPPATNRPPARRNLLEPCCR
ncbi:Gfo/Idh/MocA family oxidoreductase [bacterium]|nr:Gfo/Idh/MocA family oxidoreductase [bacterium]